MPDNDGPGGAADAREPTREQLMAWASDLLSRECAPENVAEMLRIPLAEVLEVRWDEARSADTVPPRMVYDTAFRTGVQELPRFVIRFTNSVFGTSYADTEEVVYGPTQLMMRDESKNLVQRAADSNFAIARSRYQYECDSGASKDMGPRIWQYSIPLADVRLVDLNKTEVTFPSSAVIYLRPPAGLADQLITTIVDPNAPGGRPATFDRVVKVVVPNKWGLQEMLEPGHLLLMPFYLFRYDSEFRDMSDERAEEVLGEVRKLSDGLGRLLEEKQISRNEGATLLYLFEMVTSQLARRCERIVEGVRRIMDNSVFRTPVKVIYDDGVAWGEKRGEERGKTDMVRALLALDVPVDKIAKAAGWSKEAVLAQAGK